MLIRPPLLEEWPMKETAILGTEVKMTLTSQSLTEKALKILMNTARAVVRVVRASRNSQVAKNQIMCR
jgi:hypothetical protein